MIEILNDIKRSDIVTVAVNVDVKSLPFGVFRLSILFVVTTEHRGWTEQVQ
jgi:hypothetical protein